MMTDRIRRWWQSLGFGIQSRTDYEYLKEVLRQPLPYYAYSELGTEDNARLIFRICNHARKGRITMVGSFTAQELRAAELALGKRPECCASLPHAHDIDTVIVNNIDTACRASWHAALQRPCISWDMRHIGIAQYIPGRYPEHYQVSS